jgi:hypothetical protein
MPTRRDRANVHRATLLVAVALAAVIAAGGLLATAPGVSADYETDCAAPTAVFDETNMPANLNLTATDVIVFASGTFTGSVNSNGATICVAGPAAFNPSSFNGTGRLFVRGEASMPALAVGSGASLDNEGTVTFLPQPNVNGVADIINRAGAILTVQSNLALGAGVTVTNDGTLEVTGDVNFGGAMTNNGTVVNGGVLVLTGSITNNATMSVAGQTTIDSGATLTNLCRYSSDGMISNDTIVNAGVIDLLAGDFLDNGAASMTQTATGLMLGNDFTNSGTITGAGQFAFEGVTLNEGVIAGDSADSPIVFEDETPTGDQIFDIELGTTTNVVRGAVEVPGPDDCGVLPPTTTTSSTSTSTTSTSTTSTSTTSTTVPTTSTSTTSTSTTVPTTSTSTTSTSTTVPSTSTSTTSTTPTTLPITSSTGSTTTTASDSPTLSPAGPGRSDGSTTTTDPDSDAVMPGAGGGGSSGRGSQLPRTGAPVVRLAAVGALLVLAGGALGSAVRLRRPQSEGQ